MYTARAARGLSPPCWSWVPWTSPRSPWSRSSCFWYTVIFSIVVIIVFTSSVSLSSSPSSLLQSVSALTFIRRADLLQLPWSHSVVFEEHRDGIFLPFTAERSWSSVKRFSHRHQLSVGTKFTLLTLAGHNFRGSEFLEKAYTENFSSVQATDTQLWHFLHSRCMKFSTHFNFWTNEHLVYKG